VVVIAASARATEKHFIFGVPFGLKLRWWRPFKHMNQPSVEICYNVTLMYSRKDARFAFF
ncbi:MAG: hypothetical protein ABJN42_24280, partial [Roseibium sp.]|uniref:hypothetical protein n=1 Tax=Roseibium sp. TaxID=1936156 RepID=UPI00329870A9